LNSRPLRQINEHATVAHARTENRFVLLDLAAVWCHWCRVMGRGFLALYQGTGEREWLRHAEDSHCRCTRETNC
jgi:uncharacterized protein YyaL (SSP411 family)